jgi:uncharacterized caspase-like protein
MRKIPPHATESTAGCRITALKKTTADAHKVSDVLKSLGYEVIFGTDLGRRKLEDLAQEFSTKLKGADAGLFYYSGHGFQTNRTDQQHPINHIVPIDF